MLIRVRWLDRDRDSKTLVRLMKRKRASASETREKPNKIKDIRRFNELPSQRVFYHTRSVRTRLSASDYESNRRVDEF